MPQGDKKGRGEPTTAVAGVGQAPLPIAEKSNDFEQFWRRG
jgi:hypothetical protein